MKTIRVRLPASLHGGLLDAARREGISVDGLIRSAIAAKVSALRAEDLAARGRSGSRDKFDSALSRIHDVPPDPGDEPPGP